MFWGLRRLDPHQGSALDLLGVVMYCTPGHLCPGCVVHHYSQFYGKIFWNKAIAQTNLKKVIVQAIAQANLTKVIVQAIAQSK